MRSSPTRLSPASRGFIDDVIMPHSHAAASLPRAGHAAREELENPWKKHDNIPL